MLKNKCFTIIMIGLFQSLFAQDIEISGSITDSIGNPLELANIIALDNLSGEMVNYAISDTDGHYKILVEREKEYQITASFLGMRPTSKNVSREEAIANLKIDFLLVQDPYHLEGVELVYEMPVVRRGDTIIYSTDAFTNGTERKLGDVLDKIPGIEVDNEGEIKVEGKKVSKVMVNGKDFFDGDSKLATKNIPADVLSKVEVLKNYNEVDQMRGLGNDQDNTAINIRLKEGKEKFWFGEIEAGGGYGDESRFAANSRLFYYSPESSINLIGNANNIGETAFTFKDYFNFNGGLGNLQNDNGTLLNLNESGLGFLLMQNERAKRAESKFVAGNFNAEVSKKIDLSGYAIFNDSDIRYGSKSTKNYIQNTATENLEENSNNRNQLGMAKLSLKYKPAQNFQLDYEVLGKKMDQGSNYTYRSVFNSDQATVINPIEEIRELSPWSVNQNLNAYYTLSDRNIFAGYFDELHSSENPSYTLNSRINPFPELLPEVTDDELNLLQNKLLTTNKYDGKLEYYRVLNRKSNLNFSVGFTVSDQYLESNIRFEETNSEDPRYLNDVDYYFKDFYVGLAYKLKAGIFTISPGFTLHDYTLGTNRPLGKHINEEVRWLPSFFALAQFTKGESLRFNYRLNSVVADINHYAPGYIFSNYNSVSQGNQLLENALYHRFDLNYFNFNMFNFTNITANLNYEKRQDPLKYMTVLQGINRINTPFNIMNNEETLGLNGGFQKTFRKFKTSLNSGISYAVFYNVVNGEELRSENFNQNYELSFRSNFKKPLNFEVGYRRGENRYMNGMLSNAFITDEPFAELEYSFGNFGLMADYSYFSYRNESGTLQNTFELMNAEIVLDKPDRPWKFGLSIKNILNVGSVNRDSFTQILTTTTSYSIQPRIIMASIKYEL